MTEDLKLPLCVELKPHCPQLSSMKCLCHATPTIFERLTRTAVMYKIFGIEMGTSSDRLDAASSRQGIQQPLRITSRVRSPSAEQPTRTREYKTSEAKEVEELRSTHKEMETQLSSLKLQHDDLTQKYYGLTIENQKLRTWVSHITQNLESVDVQKKALEQELRACKDDLFKMQPRIKVPDSEIVRAFEDLDEHICSWVEGHIARSEKNLEADPHGSLSDLFHHDYMPGVKEVLSSCPTSGGEYILCYMIHAMLQEMVFEPDILSIGLDEPNSVLIRRTEGAMEKASSSRGNCRCHLLLSMLLTEPMQTTTPSMAGVQIPYPRCRQHQIS